jgi:hypothetical protein
MKYTVGMRLKARVAKTLRMEYSEEWLFTNYYEEESDAEAQRAEWARNKRNDSMEFRVIKVAKITHTGVGKVLSTTYVEVYEDEEAYEKPEWITSTDAPCSDPRCLR